MLDETAMVAMRVGATLGYVLPRVRLRIRHGDDLLLEVRRPDPGEAVAAGAQVVPPCAFRCVVADAHERFSAGQQLSFLGLPAGMGPAIDVGLPPGDAALAGDVYRVALAGDWMAPSSPPR